VPNHHEHLFAQCLSNLKIKQQIIKNNDRQTNSHQRMKADHYVQPADLLEKLECVKKNLLCTGQKK